MHDRYNQIITHLNADQGPFKEIGTLESFAAMNDPPPTHRLPACYLIPEQETALDNQYMGNVVKAEIKFSFIIVVSPKTAINKRLQLNPVQDPRKHILKKMCELQFDGYPVDFQSGELAATDKDYIWWKDNYKTQTSIGE